MDSQYFSPAVIGGVLFALLLALLLSVFVGGALLRLSTRWVAGFTPGYLRCCGAMALSIVIGLALQFVVTPLLSLLGAAGGSLLTSAWSAGTMAVLLVASFALSALALALAVLLLVRTPEGARMPFGRAFALSALTTAMGFVLYVACVAILLFAVGGVPGLPR
jgi:hypothetical protein